MLFRSSLLSLFAMLTTTNLSLFPLLLEIVYITFTKSWLYEISSGILFKRSSCSLREQFKVYDILFLVTNEFNSMLRGFLLPFHMMTLNLVLSCSIFTIINFSDHIYEMNFGMFSIYMACCSVAFMAVIAEYLFFVSVGKINSNSILFLRRHVLFRIRNHACTGIERKIIKSFAPLKLYAGDTYFEHGTDRKSVV